MQTLQRLMRLPGVSFTVCGVGLLQRAITDIDEDKCVMKWRPTPVYTTYNIVYNKLSIVLSPYLLIITGYILLISQLINGKYMKTDTHMHKYTFLPKWMDTQIHDHTHTQISTWRYSFFLSLTLSQTYTMTFRYLNMLFGSREASQ